LASVPTSQAADIIAELRAAGYDRTAEIGRFVKMPKNSGDEYLEGQAASTAVVYLQY
jgi:hypothetical protein